MSETIKENYDVKDSKIDLKKHEDNFHGDMQDQPKNLFVRFVEY